MGTYNSTVATLTCPRCNRMVECNVDLYFGNTSQMVTIPLGSRYPFHEGRAPQNGGPLTIEYPGGPGYTECPSCGRDFHCVAEIRDGILNAVSADMTTLPYQHDYEAVGKIPCPRCHSVDTLACYYNGFVLGRITCKSKACAFEGVFSTKSKPAD